QGWTPFLRACRAFYEPEVIKLFLEHGANINGKNKDGETPLHIMAQHRSSYDCLELLIAEGANVDAQDNNGWTPLMKAVCHPQAMMRKDVIYGLAHNSDTSIKNKEGKTAYDIAKENAAFNDEKLLLILKPVEDLTEDEFHKIFQNAMGGNNE
ncbi:MAG: ankyrin repeat domain-containing protein, partial [Alphaproteobacteria bacterium]|nr:ankyrin repeat domain-containing protein [Alphaproteobacteria bacterium]